MNRFCVIPMGVFLLTSVFGFCSAAYADLWVDHVVFQGETDEPRWVHAADRDGDGEPLPIV